MKAGLVVPTLVHGDAVGNDVLGMARHLRRRGFDVRFFNNGGPSPEEVRPVEDIPAVLSAAGDVLIYHHSIGFDRGVRAVENSRLRTAVKYHNVTPPEYFRKSNPMLAKGCQKGIDEVGRLADSAAAIWVDSPYNGEHVRSLRPGRAVAELPPFHHADHLLALEPDHRAVAGFDDWTTTLLAVGRVMPNKNMPLAVAALADYRRRFDPNARLILAGSHPMPQHADEVRQAVEQCGQGGHVFLTGKVTDAQLKALYLLADALLVTSTHEGFCVPLVEAMGLRLPVVAVPVTAVPGTGGDAAVYADADPAALADKIDGVLTDDGGREALVHRGRERYAAKFSTAAVERRFDELLDGWLGERPGVSRPVASVGAQPPAG